MGEGLSRFNPGALRVPGYETDRAGSSFVIKEQRPESLSQLAEFSERAPSNLSRTFKTMERFGLVEFRRNERNLRPIAKASEFVIQVA